MKRLTYHFALLGAIALVGACATPARGVLLASYDFENNLNDSSGNGHHGLLVGSASIVSDPVRGNVLSIPSTSGTHGVNIDSIRPIPNFPAQTSITLSAWYKRSADLGENYRYVVNLGQNTDNPIASLGVHSSDRVVSYSETNLPGTNTDQVDVFGTTTIEGGAAAWQQWHHLAVVYNRATDFAHIYLDGVLDSTQSISLLSDTHGFDWPAASIGYGPAGSSTAPGLIDEVRIFTHALTAGEIATLAEVPFEELRAVVNRTTGEITIESVGTDTATFDFYQLSSPSFSLSRGEWNSLSEQGFQRTGIGPHQRWQAMGGSSELELGEVFLASHSTLDPNTAHSIGMAYNNAIDGQDLAFEYRSPDGPVKQGTVVYIGAAPPDLEGDFNNDGLVDAADYLVWRNNLGTPEWRLNGNGDGSGTIDVGDYELWQANYGKTAGGAFSLSQQAIPEPASLAWCVLGGLALLKVRRWL